MDENVVEQNQEQQNQTETQEAVNAEASAPAATTPQTKRFFLVCGLDDDINQDAQDAVTRMGFEPVLLSPKSAADPAVFETLAGCGPDDFAVVLLQDDDVASRRTQFPKNAVLQPVPEVVFFLGYLTAKLGASRVFPVYQPKQNFRKPCEGLPYTEYDKVGRWRFDLAKALKAAGYEVDANRLL